MVQADRADPLAMYSKQQLLEHNVEARASRMRTNGKAAGMLVDEEAGNGTNREPLETMWEDLNEYESIVVMDKSILL
jgi:hypothetical protein